MVCINGAMKERSYHFGWSEIGEVEEYKYLVVKSEGIIE